MSRGMQQALADANMTFVGVDVWAEAARVYAHHFGEAYATDIARHAEADLVPRLTREGRREVVAIVSGPPCQPFSKANRKEEGARGLNDPRSTLATSVVEIVAAVRPRVVILEQAPTLMTAFRTVLDRVCGELASHGYEVQASVVDMSFRGVPQRRRRTFVVAVRSGLEMPPCFFRPPLPVRCTPRMCEGAMWEEEGSVGIISETHWRRILAYEEKSGCLRTRDVLPDEPCRTVTASNVMSTTNDCLRVALADGRRRKLSYEEAEGLMTLPRGWTAEASSARARARLIGNAVPPAAIRHIVHPSVLSLLLPLRTDADERLEPCDGLPQPHAGVGEGGGETFRDGDELCRPPAGAV